MKQLHFPIQTPKKTPNENASANENSDSEAGSASESEAEVKHKASTTSTADKRNDSDTPVDDEDDEEWMKVQQKMTRKEKVLESKSKVSHPVHCPYFPEVS